MKWKPGGAEEARRQLAAARWELDEVRSLPGAAWENPPIQQESPVTGG